MEKNKKWQELQKERKNMEFIIENVTDKEIDILEKGDFDWYPDTLESRDVVINGNREYLKKVLKALGRQ